jgi:hypothetical protein
MRSQTYQLFHRYIELIDLFYEKSFFHALVKHRAYDFTDFLASIGGLLGLIAGVSFISLAEIGYFLTSFLSRKIWKLKSLSKVEPNSIHRREVLLAWSETNNDANRFSDYFSEFFGLSSIHGLAQISNKDRNVCGKVIWTIIVLISTFFCGSYIHEYVAGLEANPVAFEIDEKLWSVEEVK